MNMCNVCLVLYDSILVMPLVCIVEMALVAGQGFSAALGWLSDR